jgi:hypothetical protein
MSEASLIFEYQCSMLYFLQATSYYFMATQRRDHHADMTGFYLINALSCWLLCVCHLGFLAS